MLRRLSVRARITIGSVLVAALLLGVSLIGVRLQVATILSTADATLAKGDLTSFQKDITASPGEPVDDPGTGVLVYVRAPDGDVQVNTLPHDVLDLVEHRLPTEEEYETTDDEGRTFIVVGRVVSTTAGDWALWSARSTSSSELALDGLGNALAIGGVALLIAFGLASWLLATAALRPVSRMRRRAELLGADAGDGDLPVGPARDELSALATTLNEFLARVRSSTMREKQMVSDAAHELRTPLAALKTQLELAHDDFGDAAALALQVRAAEASVSRLSSLAANLLELTRLEAHEGPRSVSSSEQLVSELMGSIDRARMLGLPKRADVGFTVVAGQGQQRYALDPQAFGRLADNLLANSISAIAKGGSVEATLREDYAGLVLEVTDDGPGVPEEFLAHAFERFSRPDSARSTTGGGSGLGLALVQAIAEDADGSAELENTRPGLRVTVTIPKM
jgi:signal transduction histidine kinase